MSIRSLQEVKAGLSSIPSIPCDINAGDTVTFTNEYGVSFEGIKVLGFGEALESTPSAIIYLDCDCYWFPKSEESLKVEKRYKSESAAKVLMALDSYPDAADDYCEIVRKISKEDGVSLEQLERELNPFI